MFVADLYHVPVYLPQVMLLSEAPFDVLCTTNDRLVKSNLTKENKAKNTTFIPVPDSGMMVTHICIELGSSVLHMTRVLLHITQCLKKTVQNCFCQNFVKFPPILIIFDRKIAKRLKLCEMHSFPTSPNSRHHTIV